MSTGRQPYPSDFGPGNMVTQSPMPQQQMPHDGLNALAEGSQYALQLQQQEGPQQTQNGGRPSLKHRQSTSEDGIPISRQDFSGDTKGGRNTNGNVRRRISRACDQCNQLRTKCDGKNPCAHCVEFGLSCEYARERKKRGKASRKEIAAQRAAAAGHGDGKDTSPRSANEVESDETAAESKLEPRQGVKRRRSSVDLQAPYLPPPRSGSMASQQLPKAYGGPLPSLEQTGSVTSNPMGEPHGSGAQQMRPMALDQPTPGGSLPTPRAPVAGTVDRGMPGAMSDYGSIDDYHRSILHPGATVTGHNILHSGPSTMSQPMIHGGTITGYGAESAYGVPSPSSQQGLHGAPYRIGESPMSGFLGQSPVAGSPGWFSLPSPSATLYPGLQNLPSSQPLRYPVLRPLLPHISAIIPIGLACDLLELFFASTTSTFLQPQSPYILGYVFRKRSFLRQHNPRPSSPALLASMLWVAAQTSDSAFLTSPPSARGKICQKLLELTVGLLKPLVHTPSESPGYGSNPVVNNGVFLGGFGVSLPSHAQEMEGGCPGASGQLDDVVTYINLATVVSASEYKAASLRWWNAAFSLARELKLGRELPPNPVQQHSTELTDGQADGEAVGSSHQAAAPAQNGTVHDEEREERRRIWWLLYSVDRHLALCYNRPLFLLDVECESLLQPENDIVWQANEYYAAESSEPSYYRRRGPCFECTGHSIYGYFLPLMTILGEIVDLNHARNHPRFGLRFRNGNEWEEQVQEITQQLEAYGRSLQEFEAQHTRPPAGDGMPSGEGAVNGGNTHNGGADTSPSNESVGTNHSNQRMTESQLQSKILVAYGTHLMHTLHILLNGKWDPISLLDDNDLWISSQSFVSATGHAVSAAEAINDILDYDPDLSFMPFFFGIYLLQGSFLLLLIADKLQGEASPSVVKACETIVRAHEACVVTLNTEYQVSQFKLGDYCEAKLIWNTEELSQSDEIGSGSSQGQDD